MSDIIEDARRLKAEAMDARDAKAWDRAMALLKTASDMLNSALIDLGKHRGPGELPGRQEIAVAAQLGHVLGSRGGVLRRAGNYEAAALAYDEGNKVEELVSSYGIENSYNLVQRLVARIFFHPKAVLESSEPVLGLLVPDELSKAEEEILRQIDGQRSEDEYAKADLATVRLLLDHEDWELSLDDFLSSQPEPYAIETTLELLEALRDRVASTPDPLPGLEQRLAQAVLRLSTGV